MLEDEALLMKRSEWKGTKKHETLMKRSAWKGTKKHVTLMKRSAWNEKARIKRASKKAGASLANMAVGKFDGKHLMNDIFSSSGVTEANGICCAPDLNPNLN